MSLASQSSAGVPGADGRRMVGGRSFREAAVDGTPVEPARRPAEGFA